MIFLRASSGLSSSQTVALRLESLLLIFLVGSIRLLMRAPDLGRTASGRTNVSPYLLLKRSAMSRVSSTCCFWSSPTGTWWVS